MKTSIKLLFACICAICFIVLFRMVVDYMSLREGAHDRKIAIISTIFRTAFIPLFDGEDDAYKRLPSHRFRTSTEYFKYMVTNGWVDVVDYSLFAEKGVPPARSINASDFLPANNAWCVVIPDVTNIQPNAPFMITRNISCFLPDVPNYKTPYGTNAVIIIPYGREYRVINGRDVIPENLGLSEDHLLFP